MARKAIKALKDTTKVLGGLGAAYMLSEALGPKVRPEDVNEAEALKDPTTIRMRQDAARARGEPVPAPAPAVTYTAGPTEANAIVPRTPGDNSIRSRVVIPPELARSPSLREIENRIDMREQANRQPAILKKGGVTRADGIAQRGKTRGKMV